MFPIKQLWLGGQQADALQRNKPSCPTTLHTAQTPLPYLTHHVMQQTLPQTHTTRGHPTNSSVADRVHRTLAGSAGNSPSGAPVCFSCCCMPRAPCIPRRCVPPGCIVCGPTAYPQHSAPSGGASMLASRDSDPGSSCCCCCIPPVLLLTRHCAACAAVCETHTCRGSSCRAAVAASRHWVLLLPAIRRQQRLPYPPCRVELLRAQGP